jgi:XapX domain-containing protein
MEDEIMKDFLIQCFMSLGTGFLTGVIFALLKLPVPAPAVLPGVMGILGITLGFLLVTKFIS